VPASTRFRRRGLLQQKITTGEQQSSGAAWAAMTAPGVGSIWDRTAIEARVDPSQEQSRLGTSLSKSVTLDERTSLTLQNGSSVTQQGVAAIPAITGHQPATPRWINRHD